MKKAGFNKDKTLEENLGNRPADVVDSQWLPLVTMWTEKEDQALAAKNVENIHKQTVKHTGGSKPHMEYARELKDAIGTFPERIYIFKVTHTKNRNTSEPTEAVMDPVTAELYGKMVEIQNWASQPDSGVVLAVRNDVVAAVLGPDRKGRVHCLGNTMKPKEFWGAEPSSSKVVELQIENASLRQQLAERDNRIAELETQVGTMQSILAGYNAFTSTDQLPPNPNNE